MFKRTILITLVALFIISIIAVIIYYNIHNSKIKEVEISHMEAEEQQQSYKNIVDLNSDHGDDVIQERVEHEGYTYVKADHTPIDKEEFNEYFWTLYYDCMDTTTLYPEMHIYKTLIKDKDNARLYTISTEVLPIEDVTGMMLFDGVDTYYLVVNLSSISSDYTYCYKEATDLFKLNEDKCYMVKIKE